MDETDNLEDLVERLADSACLQCPHSNLIMTEIWDKISNVTSIEIAHTITHNVLNA